jgi:hypothetical protein
MNWVLILGCVIATWLVLRIVGGEREKRLAELDRAARQSAEQQASQDHARN